MYCNLRIDVFIIPARSFLFSTFTNNTMDVMYQYAFTLVVAGIDISTQSDDVLLMLQQNNDIHYDSHLIHVHIYTPSD